MEKNKQTPLSRVGNTDTAHVSVRSHLTPIGPKVYLRTYGCQMNEYDSELVRTILTDAGYIFTDSLNEADIVLLNTCSVRENAHRKVYGHIHEIRFQKRGQSPSGDSPRNKPFILGILGCMATAMKNDLLYDPNLGIDLIAGPDSYRHLPQMIQECAANERRGAKGERLKTSDIDLSELETYSNVHPTREDSVNAWVAITRGCNNFCSFCIVPYARGRERSRTPTDIITEVKKLAADGFTQVTLLGQNVNSYKSDTTDFIELLESIAQIDKIKRIRFMSPHPKDFPAQLITTIAQNPKVCKHIHLPLQAGSDRILQMMNRNYTQQQYRELVASIRREMPDITLTTDIIVGFPTETSEDFDHTYRLMKEIGFDAAFIFKYSPREGTRAAKDFSDDVPEEEKTRRIVLLNELQKATSLAKNTALVGTTCTVLIERETTTHGSAYFQARSSGNKLIIIPVGNYQEGDYIEVTITGASAHVLKGTPTEEH